jgi:hypothetical protein
MTKRKIPWDKMKQVNALGTLAFILTSSTGQFDSQNSEKRLIRCFIPEAEKTRVEISTAQQRADADEGGLTDYQKGRNLLRNIHTVNTCVSESCKYINEIDWHHAVS